ncbi:MAG: cobyrinate a,c-diamide synthase [Deltaproteobacteria bacterium]|nr:cobyrinate a,c-diamide synthase [Deltaproteobacteria bacterium]
MARCPTLVIAGTNSGVGKTSFTLALARALFRRGLKVQTFKVGPDFLDPTYLALASGRPCYNLDGWMAGTDHSRHLFSRAVSDADCALVEGVMGLFDGADPAGSEGSTAEIARLLDAPVLLVANVHGMGRSFAALVRGFATFETGLSFAGVVANCCGSERHTAWLSDSLRAAGLPPLLGAIPRGAFPELASRHLGLVTADRTQLPEPLLDAWADALERHIQPGALFPGMRLEEPKADRVPAPGERCETGDPRQLLLFPEPEAAEIAVPAEASATARAESARPRSRLRIAIARDEAFHFYYPDLFDALAAAGCDLAFFSPLTDSRLPEGISGLYLGGGYPELYAAKLAANGEMLAAIRAYGTSGRPLYAECGGLMYLSRGIEAAGRFHPLSGLLPVRTRMLPARKALGYVEVTLTEDSLWGRRGDTLRGHEFHYSEPVGDPASDPAWRKVYSPRRRRSDAVEAEGYQNGAILMSYLHLHYASRPAAIARFIERCGGQP